MSSKNSRVFYFLFLSVAGLASTVFPDDLKTLGAYKDVPSFEGAIDSSIQDCLDNSNSDRHMMDCYTHCDTWGQEVTTYSSKLLDKLDKAALPLFQVAQDTWEESQQKAQVFSETLSNPDFTESSSRLAGVQRTDIEMGQLVENRALIIRNWAQLASNKAFSNDGLKKSDKSAEDLDKELNVSYKKLAAKLSKEQRLLLIDSERAWIKNRDAIEKFSSSISKADVTNQILASNLKIRIDLLDAWFEDKE
jgi:uncharacterized protein YecT (DUF1311 family)